jgi:uncharacterized membrane protein YeaQ/YmgE (transglycosylase-associated protein family)
MDGIIVFLLIGLVAGFLASKLMGAESHGIVANLIIGVIGAIIGGFLFGRLGIGVHGLPPLLMELVSAVIGSMILLVLLRFIRK